MVKLSLSRSTPQTVGSFLNFINKSPSPFHAVKETAETLMAAGFQPLRESDTWNSVQPGGKYYVTRNQSAIVAFAVGGKFKPGNGFHVIGAHTDSPCLKVKPVSSLESNGWLQVGVECYGGGLFHTWFDRDLGLAGRVIVNDKDSNTFQSRLVLINKPIMRIPTLAIHLDRDVGTKGFQFNKETQLRPVIATAARAELESTVSGSEDSPKHQSVLMQLLAKELDVEVDAIRDFELCLFDTQGANTGGALDEFIYSPRLDNLCCSWLATKSLVDSSSNLEEDSNVRVAALFDNEEVGSNSRQGAASNFLQSIMERVSGGQLPHEATRKSVLVSADMAHAVHPNYAEKHESNHRPALHKGPVIKYNANERYATTSESAFLLKEIARRHEVPIQEFVVRQDMGCGSTIGPILSTESGIRTIDVGVAQLSMHSIREMCGTEDLEMTLKWFTGFYAEFADLDSKLTTD